MDKWRLTRDPVRVLLAICWAGFAAFGLKSLFDGPPPQMNHTAHTLTGLLVVMTGFGAAAETLVGSARRAFACAIAFLTISLGVLHLFLP
jgi:hypothetical protein